MRLMLAVILAASAVSCAKSSSTAASPTAVATPSPATASASPSVTAAPSERVVFHAYGVGLNGSVEEGSERIRIVPNAAGSLTVTLRGTDGTVNVCPFTPPSQTGSCSAPANGASVTLQSVGVEVHKTSGERYIDEISVEYTATKHNVRVLSPNIIPKPGQSVCKDNGCNPFYELTPHRAGTVDATSNWEGIATGKLLIELGRVAEHGLSRTGEQYRVPAQAQRSSDGGPPNLHVSTTVAATEVAVVLENEGARLLRTPTLELTWP
jgi:hypothetical protein